MKVFISDCEGPISKNDNAFELVSHFIPNGNRLFAIVSKYDDVAADLLKKPDYKAGDTLKLVLPFLRAHSVSDRDMKAFSEKNLLLIPNVKAMLNHVRRLAPTYLVSTSYEHYIKALCRCLNFPFHNTYCTKVCLDEYCLTEPEKEELIAEAQEISQMEIFEIPRHAKRVRQLPLRARTTIEELDDLFWKRIAHMPIGRIYSEVNPVGGEQKAEAILQIAERSRTDVSDVMYVGDSITDESALKLVRKNGGLTVSFNGNHYAVKNSDIALMSEDGLITAIVADAFVRFGKCKTLEIIAEWNHRALKTCGVTESLLRRFLRMHPSKLPKAKIVTRENRERLADESTRFRKRVRGEAVGRLG